MDAREVMQKQFSPFDTAIVQLENLVGFEDSEEEFIDEPAERIDMWNDLAAQAKRVAYYAEKIAEAAYQIATDLEETLSEEYKEKT